MPDAPTPPSTAPDHVHEKFDSARGWWDCPACYPEYARQADDRASGLAAALTAEQQAHAETRRLIERAFKYIDATGKHPSLALDLYRALLADDPE